MGSTKVKVGVMDIVCGRGKGYDDFPGNVEFRRIINEHAAAYSAKRTTRTDKSIIIRIIAKELLLHHIRFLKCKGDKGWVVLSEYEVNLKIGHALRGVESARRKASGSALANNPGKSAQDHLLAAPPRSGKNHLMAFVLGTKDGDAITQQRYPGYGDLTNIGGALSMPLYHLQTSMSDVCHKDSLKSLLTIHSIQSQPPTSPTSTCQYTQVQPSPPAHEEQIHGEEEWNPISLESVTNTPSNPLTINDLHLVFAALGEHSEMTGGNLESNW